MGDFIETIEIFVEIQANGIIRNQKTGRIIARLIEDEDVLFEKLKEFDIRKVGEK